MSWRLASLACRFVLVFFDDILVHSPSFEAHVDHLRQVFQWLCANQWKLKLSKCTIARESISYLGHVVSSAGLSSDPAKVQAVMDWPVPSSVKELRGFLGLAGYYTKFVRHFTVIAEPLLDLLKKDLLFIWTNTHAKAFTVLKQALCSAPVLALPDFSVPFHIETDASGSGVGAVLQQNGHPLAFINKALSPRNQDLSVYEKEYLAVLLAVKHWRHYLRQAEFFIHTDHRSLIHLNEQRLHTAWQQKMFAKLLGLQYKIIYKKGADNGAANALSRRGHSQQPYAISSVTHSWL